ncbi:tetratricopeptide repeat protein [Sphingobium bisphenolivorans]|uniref:tetratricopeptide repeat protein n=1 Tax=Sphingobium bisphenolivorans TaxID=1335760 RepID=UPI0003AA1E40|nr:tetratricopeptide repeat protein [Sphingobium bisphenolivorans]
MIRAIALALLLASPALAAEKDAPTRSLYLQLIHQARSDGRARAALAYLDDFDRRYPGDADARLLRVNSLLDLGQIDAAEAVPLPQEPKGPVAAVHGHLLAARGNWAQAVPFYRSAAAASPADPLLRNALGYAQLRAGATADATESFRAALDLAPRDPVIRNNLLLARTLGGESPAVDAALRRTLLTEAARIAKGH